MFRNLIAAFLVLASTSVAAQPYVAASLIQTTPEFAAGFSAGRFQFEAATFGENQIDSVNRIGTFEEWTVQGNRLTVRALFSATKDLSFGIGASVYDMRYEHKLTNCPTTTVKATTNGLSLSAVFRINDSFGLHAEAVHIKTPSEAFGLEDLTRLRVGFAYSF